MTRKSTPMKEGSDQDRASDLERVARTALDWHGFTFQHKVIDELRRLAAELGGAWSVEVPEFPVVVNGEPTHIDAIAIRAIGDQRSMLVCECKRVAKERAAWCFFKAPYLGKDGHQQNVVCEYLLFDGVTGSSKDTRLRRAGGVTAIQRPESFNIGLELEDSDRNDKEYRGAHDTIERACTQVCRGLNGLVEHFAHVSSDTLWQLHTRIYPVIVTTAPLYVSRLSLLDSDLATGKIAVSEMKLEAAPWIYYRYVQSPGITHSHRLSSRTRPAARGIETGATHSSPAEFFELGKEMTAQYVRSILIANALSLKELLIEASSLP